jgi:hypothetical protein
MTAGETKPLPDSHYETTVSYVILLGDRVVSMNKGTDLIDSGFNLKIPVKGKYQVVLTGMKPQKWNIISKDGKIKIKADVKEGKNTIYFQGNGGEYVISTEHQ